MDVDPATTLAQVGQSLIGKFDDSPPLSPSDNPRHATPGSSQNSRDSDGASARETLEQTLTELDGGAGAVACSTGGAAVSTVTHLFDADAHVLCARGCNADTVCVFSHLAERGRLSVSYEAPSDRDALTDAVQPNTAALWVDAPSHTLLRAVNLEALSAFAEVHDLLLIVDNTVLSPVLQRPIEHGADLVVYSSLRNVSGHSDVTGGAVIARTEALAEELSRVTCTYGTGISPADSEHVLRGAKTLPVRMQQRETNARSLAHFLDEHPAVDHVCYPGLRDHPGHERARTQQDGYGGTISFFVNETQVDIEALLQTTELFSVTEALGGVESGIEHPVSMSHASLPVDHREAAGISNGLVRLSVGLEATDDLLQDLEQALETARTPEPTPERAEREPVPVRVEARG